jgi:hypothetical protein
MKKLQVSLSILVIFGLLVGLTGCRSNPMTDVPAELEARVRTFEDVVRWRPLHKMYAFQKLESDQTVEIQKGLDNIRVTGYEIVEPLNAIDPLRWRQVAEIRYVLTDRQVVRQLIDLQVWESEGEDMAWYRTTPVPVFR